MDRARLFDRLSSRRVSWTIGILRPALTASCPIASERWEDTVSQHHNRSRGATSLAASGSASAGRRSRAPVARLR